MKKTLFWLLFLAIPVVAVIIITLGSEPADRESLPTPVVGLSASPDAKKTADDTKDSAAKRRTADDKTGTSTSDPEKTRGGGRDRGDGYGDDPDGRRRKGDSTSGGTRGGKGTAGGTPASNIRAGGTSRKKSGTSKTPEGTAVTGGGATVEVEEVEKEPENIPPASLSGRIVDVFRHPIRGAAIIVEGETVNCRASSGLNGIFNLENITPSTSFCLTVTAIGMIDYVKEGLSLGSGEHRNIGEIKLSSNGSLRIYVMSEGSHPVPDARVKLEVVSSNWVEGLDVHHKELSSKHTDLYGLAAFDRIAPGEYEIEVTHPDYATSRVREINIGGEGSQDVNVKLVNQVTISGTIVNEYENPFPGVKVEAHSHIIGASFKQHVFSDDKGNYAVPVQPRSRCRVIVSAYGYKTKTYINVQAGTHGYDIKMEPEPGFFLSGRVIDETTREPIKKFAINDQWFDNASGTFRVRRTPGQHTITVSAHGYAQKKVTFQMPQSGEFELPDIEMTRGAMISGTVLNPAGQPQPGAKVTVHNTNCADDTNNEGVFVIYHIPAGDHKAIATHPDYGAGEVNVPGLVEGGNAAGLVIRLKAGGFSVKGFVVNAAGDKLNGALVQVIGTNYSATTDDNGAFIISGLPNQKIRLKASLEGYLPKETGELTAAAEPPAVTITLSSPTIIHGQVIVGENPAPEGVEVKLLDVHRKPRVTLTDNEGKYVFNDLSPGTYYVGIPSMFLVRRRVDLAEGEPVQKNFKASPVVWTGTVMNTNGSPVPNAFVNVFRQDNWALITSFTADLQGAFRVPYLKPGKYVLHLSKTSCVTNYFSLDVEMPDEPGEFRSDLYYLPTPGKMLIRVTFPDGSSAANLDLRIEEMGPSVPNMHAGLGSTNASGISIVEYLITVPHRACVISWKDHKYDKPGVSYSPVVEILENGSAVETEVVVEPVGKRLFGKVSVSDGDRPDYLYTWVLDENGHLLDHTPYSNTDKYWIDSIPPGPCTVRFSSPGYKVKNIQLTIQGNQKGCPAVVLEKEPE
ncbi:MAG: carboxypeptidase regulatory-like domain-containing protein [Planctomycetota bacterium]|nr:MAG: carboxypeptidase regulatory-like domain-containing protein [Planctomycetota bacterium]